MGILNKEALGCALEKFSESFYKVYLINLTKDSYEVIKVSDEEVIPPSKCLSKELSDIVVHKGVYDDDVERFVNLTKLEFLRDYFIDNDSFQIRYRRAKNGTYRWAILKMIRHPSYSDDDQILYMYVYDTHAEPLSASRYKNDQLKVLNSIAEIYISMHLIDLKHNTITLYGTKDHIEVHRRKDVLKDIAEQMRNVIRNVVIPEYLDDALEFTDLTTLVKRMGSKKVLTSQFIGKFKGWFRAQFVAVDHDENGDVQRVVFTTRVIEEEMKKLESFKLLSETDELTLTSNRRVFTQDIDDLEKSDKWSDVKLLTVDVNGLKRANDTYGHKAGDELIIGTAYCLSYVFNGYGKVYRVGGDEFFVVTSISDDELSEKLDYLKFSMEKWKGELIDKLSFSIGVSSVKELSAIYPSSVSVKELMHHSDLNMYNSKQIYYRESGFDRRAHL